MGRKMEDLAHQAFSTKNYDLASEIFDRRIREYGPSVELYMGLGDSYAGAGLLDKAFSAYSKAFRLGNISPNQLNNLVNALVERMGDDLKAKTKMKDEDNIFACFICKGIWNDPVTISCGHTFCRKCLDKTASPTCKTCAVLHKHSRFSNLKTNVLLSSIIDKWFPDEVKAVKYKASGNALFSAKKYREAIDVYTEAIKLAPSDHLLRSNRSLAYESMENYKEALHDAEQTIKLRPDWAKGYYRKGSALSSLSYHEAAAMAYLQCLTLDPSVSSARSALAQTLHKVLAPLPPEDVKMAELQSVMSGPLSRHFSSSNYPQSEYGPTSGSLLNSVINERLLVEIKDRLRETLLHNGVVTEDVGNSSDSSQTNETPSQDSTPSSASTCQRLSPLVSKRCRSAPNSRSSSPLTIPGQSSGSFSSNATSETNLTRKRSSENIRKEETSCAASSDSSPPRKKSLPEEKKPDRAVPSQLLEKEDFECSLCYRLLFSPVTTPCGHAYCRGCLDRSLDHNSSCPLCKSSLVEYLAERRQVTTEAIESIIQTYLPEEYVERKKQFEEELDNLARMDSDQFEIPIFVCTLGYPSIPCPLHVFEPRYRLMIRQCMEAGTRQFGMCICLTNDENDFADFGTMLEVRNVEYFPDGRSVVDTVGGRRFKVISRGHRDGYNTATVEYLKDIQVPEGPEFQELTKIHDEAYKEAKDWFSSLPPMAQLRIRRHFGQFPELEPNHLRLENGPSWLWWLTAVMPLDSRAQLTILAQKSLRERLSSLRRVLNYVQRTQPK